MTAETGHNPQPPADAILAVQFARFLRAEAELSDAKAQHKDDLTFLDGKGLNLKAAKIAAPIIRKGAAATREYAALIRDVLALLEIGGAPVESDQIEMFPVVDARTPADERAYQEGRRAAFFDKSDGDNPHDLSTPQGQEWIRGFRQGTKEVGLIMSMEEAETERIPGHDVDEGTDHEAYDPFAESLEAAE